MVKEGDMGLELRPKAILVLTTQRLSSAGGGAKSARKLLGRNHLRPIKKSAFSLTFSSFRSFSVAVV